MHVVLLGNSIEDISRTPSSSSPDAQTIGKLQAEKMVSKLKLDKASKDNPKYIEVLLPYTAVDENTPPTIPRSPKRRSVVSGRYWPPYYQKGVVESPSGTLTANPRKNDWQAVAYDAAGGRLHCERSA